MTRSREGGEGSVSTVTIRKISLDQYDLVVLYRSRSYRCAPGLISCHWVDLAGKEDEVGIKKAHQLVEMLIEEEVKVTRS